MLAFQFEFCLRILQQLLTGSKKATIFNFFKKISSGPKEKCQELFVLPSPPESQVRILALMQKLPQS